MRFARRVREAVAGSLKVKLALFIVSVLGLTIGIAPWSAIKLQERQLLEASGNRLLALEEMLRKTVVATCIVTGSQESVQHILEAVTTHGEDIDLGVHQDIEAVRLFDTKGVIRYSSRPEERGSRLSTADLSRYYGQADPVVLLGPGDHVIHTLVRPMFNQPECFSCHASEQRILGILQVSVSIDRTKRQIAGLRKAAFFATLITLGVIVVSVWLVLQQLVDQPLQGLVEVMARAEHGDLGARVETRNNDELGQLARHFNQMISKLEAAQQELEQYHREQLARADRLATIGEMAAAIAHEIRNPLTGISGALSVLSRGFPDGDPRREIVRQTHFLIDRLNKSVDDILHYSRPSVPQLHPVQLDEIVDRALSLVEGEARKAGVRVVRQAAPEIGEDAPGATVNADPHQIQQVLMNLILNAIQATAPGGQVSIRTRVSENHEAQNRAYIEVEDTGKGMSAEEAAKAFQPFFSSKAQGTGLGLPIAKQIVEQHEGRISLLSTPGKGTRVTVELPAHRATPD